MGTSYYPNIYLIYIVIGIIIFVIGIGLTIGFIIWCVNKTNSLLLLTSPIAEILIKGRF